MKIKIIIIICLSVLLVIIGVDAIYIRTAHKMEWRSAKYVAQVKYEDIDYGYSKKQIRNKLEKLTGQKLYFYKEKTLRDGDKGISSPMLRFVIIDKNLTSNEYIEVMCHELIHLKYNTINERYVQYQTFVTLFNSEFRQIALNIVYKMQYGEYLYEYECYAQIYDYLKEVNFI